MEQYAFSVIIPVFNNWEFTKNCLSSLQEHAGGASFEVIVVDNASTDETATELESFGNSLFGPAFKAIRNESNINFGPACNQGARLASADLLFFLNNDTLLTPGWYEPLRRALDDEPSLGAVGPLLLYDDNTVQHLGVACSIGGFSHLYAGFPATHPVVKRERKLQFITGAAILVPKPIFEAAGCFYEGYRNGWEDVELCVRIRQNGKELRCVTDSTIIHYESKSAGRHDRDSDEHNRRLCTARCGSAFYPDLHLHGERDGFQVVLDGWLNENLLVRANDDAKLRAACAGKPLEHLYDMVMQSPFWLWGHETLGNVLEKAGHFMEAAYFYGLIMMFYPNSACARALLRVASKAGDKELAANAAEQLQGLTALAADKERQMNKIKSGISIAEHLNDAALLKLFTGKLASL